MLLISGIKSTDDVMRGEETQLIGCINEAGPANSDGLYLFPGTHSKHIQVEDGQVVDFNTYMTGEFFELLAQKSILSASVVSPTKNPEILAATSFRQGVQDAGQGNILHVAFRVRTNELFGKLTKQENFTYLSGLIIGTELKELLAANHSKIYLFGGSNLQEYYEMALQELGLSERVHTFPGAWADEAVVRGQYKIFNQFKANA